MASPTFHLFPLLPREIRHEIFFLATPPRIVHVQTKCRDEDEEEFLEWFTNLVPAQTDQIKLHPSLAYFVHNWGRRLLRSYHDFRSQPTLESYGFTNSRPVQHAWDSPQIPINWLLDHPTIACQLLRKSRLYSTAPIPALLHTCSESRAVLIRAGYQLAFGSRSHEPHTWFHYQNDVLYLDGNDRLQPEMWDGVNLLSYSEWIIGEFEPQSLQQVRKVALVGTCFQMVYGRWQRDISSAIRLLPKLDMLYVVEWTQRSLDRLFWNVSSSPSSSSQGRDTRLQSEMYAREAWRCIPIEEVDSLFLVVGGYNARLINLPSMGHQGERLRHFQGQSGQYFQTLTDGLTKHMEDERERAVQHERTVPWQIPRVEIVHVCTEPMARQLFDERHKIWNRLVLLRRRQRVWEQHQNKGRNKRPSCSINLSQPEMFNTGDTGDIPVSPTELEWQDDWEAFDEAHTNQHWEEHPGYDVEYLVKHGRIFPPRQELSLGP
ncbi:hypothetical protein F4818DRAFT_402026 [Hypoxylon cercidicola]|nr:hypothetical protein F4818DRAFT_402026 [Hypoxylon cercidicola]